MLMLLSPLGERAGEGVKQEEVFALNPSPNFSPKGERNMILPLITEEKWLIINNNIQP
jgi:hypothetical protein